MEPLFYPEVWHGPYTANPGERAVRPRRKLISSDQTRAVIITWARRALKL
jgi:hypothetical protein